jgi:tetratricopeptide (TPR) repeat protein
LIGIFWTRLGTPVADAESGTTHEFRKAYNAWKLRGRPQIMLYFNQKPRTPATAEEMEQWRRVLDFREGLPKEGFWWPYKGKAEFERLVRGHLTKYVLSFVKTPPIPLDPDHAVDERTEIVRANPDRAEAEYRDALRRNSKSAEAHNGLGMVLYFKRELDGAAVELREAIRLNPHVGYQHNNLGCVLSEQGDMEAAETEFREAFRVDPSHAKAHANLAAILLRKGDRRAAFEQYRIASKLRPNNAAWGAA